MFEEQRVECRTEISSVFAYETKSSCISCRIVFMFGSENIYHGRPILGNTDTTDDDTDISEFLCQGLGFRIITIIESSIGHDDDDFFAFTVFDSLQSLCVFFCGLSG
ncbi:hypothetical protein KAZ93_00450 [Patescibacteria group bacterium]|nr:hypothetical protein [Patescibacteria group bacterium]